jgi:hypothetical protein
MAVFPVTVFAASGSGTATIAPDTAVAGTPDSWSVTYDPAEVFSNGLIRVTVPSGWSSPQDTSSNLAGYVTVSSTDTLATPLLSIAGGVITVQIDTLAQTETVTVVYGDDGSGSNPQARATAQTTSESGVVFDVESDPVAGDDPAPIGASPTVNVVAGPPVSLTITPEDTTITAGDFMRFEIRVVDANLNRSPVSQLRSFLLSTAPSGEFYLPSNHDSTIATLSIQTAADSAAVDYRNTNANGGETHLVIILNNDGKMPALFAATDLTVNPTAISDSVSTVEAQSPVEADGVTPSIDGRGTESGGGGRGDAERGDGDGTGRVRERC